MFWVACSKPPSRISVWLYESMAILPALVIPRRLLGAGGPLLVQRSPCSICLAAHRPFYESTAAHWARTSVTSLMAA